MIFPSPHSDLCSSSLTPNTTLARHPLSFAGQGENGAIGAAFKIQNEETNARLAKAGISLGSDKEQDQRLSDALSSFSYDSSVSKARGKK